MNNLNKLIYFGLTNTTYERKQKAWFNNTIRVQYKNTLKTVIKHFLPGKSRKGRKKSNAVKLIEM